jgi:hypothetical protein
MGHFQTKSDAFRRASIGLVLLDELTFFTLRSILHSALYGHPINAGATDAECPGDGGLPGATCRHFGHDIGVANSRNPEV